MSLFIIVHVIRVVALNIPTNYDEELKPYMLYKTNCR